MFGWKIFIHSVRLVMTNLDVAFRVSGVLYIIYAAIQIWFTLRFANALKALDGKSTTNAISAMTDGSFASMYFLMMISTFIIALWIAVSWHRFVLLEEAPSGWIPTWHGRNTLGYFGRSILIGLIIIATMFIVSLPVGVIAAATGSLGIVGLIPIIGIAISAFIFYRLSPILPAAAIGKPIGIKAAWATTANHNRSFVVIAIVTSIAGIILQIPTWLNGDPTSLVSLIYSLVVGWFMMLIGVSTLTTIYGHFIEGRNVD